MSVFSSDVQRLATYDLEGPSQDETKPKFGDWSGMPNVKDVGVTGVKIPKSLVPLLSVTPADGKASDSELCRQEEERKQIEGLQTMGHLSHRYYPGSRRVEPILLPGLTALHWASGSPDRQCRWGPDAVSCLRV